MWNRACFRFVRFLLFLQFFEASQAITADESKGIYHKKSLEYRKEHSTGDLQPLPDERGPNGAEWTNSVAICAIIKEENTTDLREWMMYHRWLGVEKIYLLENVEKPTRSLVKAIEDFVEDGLVQYSNDGQMHYQNRWYADCMRAYYHKHNWLAFIDVDEYIVLQNPKQKSLPEFLNEYKDYAALGAHWVLMGPSGRKTRSDTGGVMRDYTQCRKLASAVVKSIANTYFLANIAGNPHTFEYRNDMRTVQENFEPVPWRYDPKCGPLPPRATKQQRIDCRPITHVQAFPGVSERIAIYHFIVKSAEDFAMKVKRGSGGGTHRKWEEFASISKIEGHFPACEVLQTRADECCDTEKYVFK